MRLFVVVEDDEIVVTSRVFVRPTASARIFLSLEWKRYTDTDDHEVLALAWQAANSKARELAWIV